MKRIIISVLAVAMCLLTFTSCAPNEELLAAKAELYAMYKDQPAISSVNYKVVKSFSVGDSTFSVEWSATVRGVPSDDVKLEDGFDSVSVILNDRTETAVPYVLKATIKSVEGQTIEQIFERKIPAFKELSWTEFEDAHDGDSVVIKGVVTAVLSKSNGDSYNSLFLQDTDGAYYSYDIQSDPAEDGVEIGMTVRISGLKDIYGGVIRITDGVFEVIDAEKSDFSAFDITEVFASAESLKDKTLTDNQSSLVTIKDVEITDQDIEDGYFKFKLGELEAYAITSSDACPLTENGKTALTDAHAQHFGYIADITGIAFVNNGSFCIIPVTEDAFEYTSLPDKDDAGMVEVEKHNITFASTITDNGEYELVTEGESYSQVDITWASDSEYAVVTDDKLVVTIPEDGANVKITATFTAGDVSDTVEFELTLVKSEMTYKKIVEALYKLGRGDELEGTYRLFGKITKIDTPYSETNDSITVTIIVEGLSDKPVRCVSLKGEGISDLKTGDEITVEGTLLNNRGDFEFDSGCTFVGLGEIIDQSKTVEAAYALEEGELLPSSVTLTGVITSIDTPYSDEYKNITVTIVVDDLTKFPIRCFRLEGNGADELAVGDEITVTGIIANYRGTVEFDTGCTFTK